MTESVLITGASGCVGHYLLETLLEDPRYHLHLLVRDPARLRLPVFDRPNVSVVVGDFLDLERHSELISRMDHLIHVAAAWGKAISYEVNYRLAHRFFAMADPARVKSLLYFSTASVLDRDNSLLAPAAEHGTDYIRSKYQGVAHLDEHPLAERITTLFPTLIFGGSDRHPVSHLASGLSQLPKWLNLLRFLSLEGSLHFIHARDIARIVHHLLGHPSDSRRLVLGNPVMSVDEALGALCTAYGVKRHRTWKLEPALGWVEKLAGNRMSDWDRFSLTHRHFTYQTVNAETFGLPGDLTSLEAVIRRCRSDLRA